MIRVFIILGLLESLHFELENVHFLCLPVDLLLQRVDLLGLLGQPLVEGQLRKDQLLLLMAELLHLEGKAVSLLGQVVDDQGTVIRISLGVSWDHCALSLYKLGNLLD